MIRRWLPAVLLFAAACGGGGASSVAPSENAATPDIAVKNFLQAVADSNMTRMGRYWGTGKGPAIIVRQPADYERRLVVTQAYLRGSPYRVVGMDRVADDRMTVTVDFDRSEGDGRTCVRKVPIGVIQTGKYGWLVNSIDLNQAGAPGRPCSGPRSP